MSTTPEERAELRSLHERRRSYPWDGSDYCRVCQMRWPCPTVRLLDDIEEMQRRLDAHEYTAETRLTK